MLTFKTNKELGAAPRNLDRLTLFAPCPIRTPEVNTHEETSFSDGRYSCIHCTFICAGQNCRSGTTIRCFLVLLGAGYRQPPPTLPRVIEAQKGRIFSPKRAVLTGCPSGVWESFGIIHRRGPVFRFGRNPTLRLFLSREIADAGFWAVSRSHNNGPSAVLYHFGMKFGLIGHRGISARR